MEEQFTQSWTASIVQDQRTAEEVEEHIMAARIINKKQEQATREITSVCEKLEGVHVTLYHQFLELTENMEHLKHLLFWVRKQFQSAKLAEMKATNEARSKSKVVAALQAISREPSSLNADHWEKVEPAPRTT